jgi:hypothetical protein
MIYDSRIETEEHRRAVAGYTFRLGHQISLRGISHDDSKITDPVEKEMFDRCIPALRDNEFGTEAYQNTLADMGEGLQLHYANNRHHPEHFKDGVDGMNLVDVVEMLCDWVASAERRGAEVDFDYVANRFNLSPQLVSILKNTVRELLDVWRSNGRIDIRGD